METRDFTVNDRIYQILEPGARKAMVIAEKAMLLLGPVIPTLGMKGEDGLKKLSTALLALEPDAVDSLLMSAASISKLSFGGMPIFNEADFERHFSDKKKDVFPVLAWCLWEVVKDFLPDLGAFGQIIKAKFGEEMLKQLSPTAV